MGRVVQVEPVRADQHQYGDNQNFEIPTFIIQNNVKIFRELNNRAKQKRRPHNQGLADQQDQRADGIVDIEEPDHECPLSNLYAWLVSTGP